MRERIKIKKKSSIKYIAKSLVYIANELVSKCAGGPEIISPTHYFYTSLPKKLATLPKSSL